MLAGETAATKETVVEGETAVTVGVAVVLETAATKKLAIPPASVFSLYNGGLSVFIVGAGFEAGFVTRR